MKKLFLKLFLLGSTLNEKHIQDLASKYGHAGKWLDLGCDDGSWTKRISNDSKVEWYGVEVIEKRAELARKNGIKTATQSLESILPYDSNYFDLIHSNQVIEHLFNLDIFISEIYRVLKPGGVLLISTENPASWHNIFALFMGWQMFSHTNISSKKRSIGNPLAIFSSQEFAFDDDATNSAWEHNKLLTPRALIDLLTIHGFEILEKTGAGYHPLPPSLGNIDVNHSHFYAIAAEKKSNVSMNK